MTEFLTENARRAYPLDGEWPAAIRDRWEGTLVDACVYVSAETGDARVSLISVRRSGSSLVFTVGVPDGVQVDVTAASGLGGFATVFAQSSSVKAILTVDGRKVDAIALDTGYAQTARSVGVPFAMRCSGGGTKRVTAVTAQGAEPCTTPAYSPSDPHRVEKTAVSGQHAVLRAGEGVDVEVTGMAPLPGSLLRISAIAAPEATDVDEEPVDIMIRGDECFQVDAEPDLANDSGTVRITSACKPCCQCDDYKDAADLLKPAEARTWALNAEFDRIEAQYNAALAAFEAAKEAAEARINSADNVRVSATAVASGGLYGEAHASGSRMRIAITLLVENMTMKTVAVGVAGITAQPGGGQTDGGFLVPAVTIDGTAHQYTHMKTLWVKAGAQSTSGDGRPISASLAPGETLSATAYFCLASQTTNDAVRPLGMKAYCTVQLPGQAAVTKEVNVV